MARSVALLLVFALIVSTLAAPSQPKEEGAGVNVRGGLKESSTAAIADVTPIRRVARQINIGNGGNSEGAGRAGNGGTFSALDFSSAAGGNADVTPKEKDARQKNIGNGGNSKGSGNAGNGGNFTGIKIKTVRRK